MDRKFSLYLPPSFLVIINFDSLAFPAKRLRDFRSLGKNAITGRQRITLKLD
jgi:hypothetical protein